MDYVVGSVAALVSGNVTPNRPRLLKRALTPTKHQPSPNVTPKSEFIDDRSIFLSPSIQKKKAVVKKSPKRIFQNPELESTENGDGSLLVASPKADKVKKHLEGDLNDDKTLNKSKEEPKSPKKKSKNKKDETSIVSSIIETEQNPNESTPKKKKRKNNISSESLDNSSKQTEAVVENSKRVANTPNKIKNRRKSFNDKDNNKENADIEKVSDSQIEQITLNPKQQISKLNNSEKTQANLIGSGDDKTNKKKNKKRNKKLKEVIVNNNESAINSTEDKTEENVIIHQKASKMKNKKRKKSQSADTTETESPNIENNIESNIQNKKSKTIVNPNAVTDKESDSEHESDNEIESENEEINKKVFETEATLEESSDEEEDVEVTKKEISSKAKVEKKKEVNTENTEINTEEEIKRTLFVGNVPFSPKCKKEIKKIFSKHGQIETIRIRTVPVKDGRYTPKLAVIKNELHPERTTVNVYIKYVDEESLEKALSENNTVLNDHHLRVSRSSQTGKEHDPKCSIFIGNLPFAMEDEVLRQKFEKCGEIESVRIIRDKKTNAGKGFGYVNFASKDGVELALALTEEDLTIKNRIIRVKRCTQITNKQKQNKNQHQGPNNRRPGQSQGNRRDNSGFQRGSQGVEKGNQGTQRGYQGGNRENQSFQRRNQGGDRENHGFQRGNQGGYRGNQGFQKGNQGGQRGNQGGQRLGFNDEQGQDGAHRRIMHKRKNQDGGNDGPPNKMQKNQPNKEKKARKEFVGMTAEKKKKRKFDKGQKKKKALSEILTK